MEKEKLKIIYKKIDEIKPYPNNPRKNDDAVDIVMRSIKEFGFKVPIILDKNDMIIAGHTRIKAAKKLGLKEVPVIYAKDLTPEQIKAFRIMDNRTHEFSFWDIALLEKELDKLKLENFDISLFEFQDTFEVDNSTKDAKEIAKTIYTKKIESPVYKPSNKKPTYKELYDLTKYKQLVELINKSKISKEDKEFLKYAATRFIKFNYDKIADFYAHSDKEVQEIMEKLALVIIDFNKAIEEGFVKLTEDLAKEYLNQVE